MPLPAPIYRALGAAAVAVLDFAKEQKRRFKEAQEAGAVEISPPGQPGPLIGVRPEIATENKALQAVLSLAPRPLEPGEPLAGFLLARPGQSRFVSGLNKQEKQLLGELLKIETQVAAKPSAELLARQGAIRDQLGTMIRKQGVPGFKLDKFEVEAQIERMKAFFTRGIEFSKGGARQVTKGGSGESAASSEAIRRVASEKARGIQRVRIDTRSGRETPLIGVDAVDAVAGPFDIIIQRSPQGETILERGAKALPRK